MEPVALQVERIRMGMQTAERIADLHARRHVATLAVALTLGGTFAVGHLAGQLPLVPTVGAVGTTAAAAVQQMRGLTLFARRLEENLAEAARDIESLMKPEEEILDDG